MRQLLVGICGEAGAGKDTVAAIIHKYFASHTMAFADPIRAAVSAMLDIPISTLQHRESKEERIIDLGKSPRQIMQLLGTEFGREMIHPELWLKIASSRLQKHLKTSYVVITDVRFDNEAEMIHKLNGYIIKVVRHGLKPVAAHVSEQGISSKYVILTIVNDGTMDELAAKVRAAMIFLQSIDAIFDVRQGDKPNEQLASQRNDSALAQAVRSSTDQTKP